MHKTEQASYFGAILAFLVASPYLIGGVVVSILVAILTLLLNWAYRAKEYKLKEREFELKLQNQGKKNE
ncbi:hypothetical protein FHPHGOJG_02578 [Mannheimia haemolytica]